MASNLSRRRLRAASWGRLSSLPIAFLLLAAGHCLAQAESAMPPITKFAGKTQEEWLAFYERGERDPLMRLADVVVIFEPPPAEVLPRLVKLLRTGSDAQQAASAEAIETLGAAAKPAREELWQHFASAEGLAIEPAGRALAALGPELASLLPKLIALLPEKHDPQDLRGAQAAAAIRAAGKLGATVLIQELDRPANPRVLRTLPVLGAMGANAKDAVPAIARALDDPKLAVDAARSLAALGSVAKPALPAIKRVFAEEKLAWQPSPFPVPPPRQGRINLATYDGPIPARPLPAIDKSPRPRRYLMEAILAIGADQDCFKTIELAFAQDDVPTRLAAAESLLALRPATAAVGKLVVQELTLLVRDLPNGRRIFGLGNVDREMVSLLRNVLSDCTPECREWLRGQAGKIDPVVYAALKGTAEKKDQEQPSRAMRAAEIRAQLTGLGIDPETFAISAEGERQIDAILARPAEKQSEEELRLLASASRSNDSLRKRVEPIIVERYLAGPIAGDRLRVTDPHHGLLRSLGRLRFASLDKALAAWRAGDDVKAAEVLHLAGTRAVKEIAKEMNGADPALRDRAAKWLLENGIESAAAPQELLLAADPAGQPRGRFFGGISPAANDLLAACAPALTDLIAKEFPSASSSRRLVLLRGLEVGPGRPLDEKIKGVLRIALRDGPTSAAITQLAKVPRGDAEDAWLVEQLVPLLSSENSAFQVEAAALLARRMLAADHDLASPLAAGLHYSNTSGTAWRGLHDLGPAAGNAVPKMLEELRNPQLRLTARHLEAIAAMGPAAAEAEPDLRAAMERRDPATSCAAALALWKVCGDDRAIIYLARSLRPPQALPRPDAWDHIATRAAEYLAQIGPRALPAARWMPTLESERSSGLRLRFELARWRLTRTDEAAQRVFDLVCGMERPDSPYAEVEPCAAALLEVMPQVAERYAALPPSDNAMQRLIRARVAWQQGRTEDAIRVWRQILAESRRSGGADVPSELLSTLRRAGPAAKLLFADVRQARELYADDRRTHTLAECLQAIDPEAYRAMLEEWAKE